MKLQPLAIQNPNSRVRHCMLVALVLIYALFNTAIAATEATEATEAGGAAINSDDPFAPIDVNIRPELPYVAVDTPSGEVLIQREQNQQHTIEGDFARTSRPCPPFCIQPMQVAEGVTTIGELELLEFLQNPNRLVIDSRTLEWYLDATIPGSVHIPYTEIASRLDELGCEDSGGSWSCSDANTVALFCNGPWCGQSPTGIRAMLREGYPADRIYYYRGGMQLWQMLGLNVVEGDF